MKKINWNIKYWPKWGKWTFGIGIFVAVLAIGLGIFFGVFYGPLSGEDKETAFTYTFVEDFEGYHKGTKVDVRNNGAEEFTSPSGVTKGIEKNEDGYINFKNKKPVSVKGYDGKIIKWLKPGETMRDRFGNPIGDPNDTDHDIPVYGTQKWNSDNIYKVNIDKYAK